VTTSGQQGCLDRQLDSVGSRDSESYARSRNRYSPGENGCQFGSCGMTLSVAEAVDQTTRLSSDRPHHCRVPMTDGSDAEAGGQVDVAIAVHVEYVGTERFGPAYGSAVDEGRR